MNIQWTPDLATGILLVDNQHKELFERVNQFIQAAGGDCSQSLSETMEYLVDYVIEHFGAEESIMIKHSFEGFESHFQEHVSFIKRVYHLKKQIERDGVTAELVLAVRNEIENWLFHHIQKKDKELAGIFGDSLRNGMFF